MNMTAEARSKLLKHLTANPSLVPGIAWVAGDKSSEPIEDGFWQFGFYERTKQSNFENFLTEVEGIEFAIDIPFVLKGRLHYLLLDFRDSNYIIIERNPVSS